MGFRTLHGCSVAVFSAERAGPVVLSEVSTAQTMRRDFVGVGAGCTVAVGVDVDVGVDDAIFGALLRKLTWKVAGSEQREGIDME